MVGDVSILPFPDHSFDMIAAFGAFHWFEDQQSVGEIKRCLKENGIFSVVNKYDSGNLRNEYRTVLKKILGDFPESSKKRYNPVKILGKNGFSSIEEKIFLTTEIYSLPEYITYLQSISLWNSILNEKKVLVQEALEKHYKKFLIDGKIKREVEIRVVIGRK